MELWMGITGGMVGIIGLVATLAAIVQPILRLVPVEAIRHPQRSLPHADPRDLRVPKA